MPRWACWVKGQKSSEFGCKFYVTIILHYVCICLNQWLMNLLIFQNRYCQVWTSKNSGCYQFGFCLLFSCSSSLTCRIFWLSTCPPSGSPARTLWPLRSCGDAQNLWLDLCSFRSSFRSCRSLRPWRISIHSKYFYRNLLASSLVSRSWLWSLIAHSGVALAHQAVALHRGLRFQFHRMAPRSCGSLLRRHCLEQWLELALDCPWDMEVHQASNKLDLAISVMALHRTDLAPSARL